MNDVSRADAEAGFTLIDMVVSMVIFGLFTTMVFNLFSTAMDASANAAQPVNDGIATQPAMSALGEAVRNSPDMQPTVDGDALFVLDQDAEYTVWRVTSEGLTNGVRTFRGVREVRFEDVDGLTVVSLTTKNGYTTLGTLNSRFPKIETMFTETFMASRAPTG